MSYIPSTQPESIRQVLTHSLQLYRMAFTKSILVAFIMSTIAFIPRLISVVLERNYFAELPEYSPVNLWLLLIELCCLCLFTVLLWRIRCVMHGTRETVVDDMKVTLKKIPLIIGASLIQSLLFLVMGLSTLGIYFLLQQNQITKGSEIIGILSTGLPFVLQMLFNIYVLFLLIFYLPLILTENKHIFEALAKSARLVWGNWWKTFFTLATPWFCYLLTLLIVKKLFGIDLHVYFMPVTLPSLSTTLVHIIIFALYIPWTASTILVKLHDLEIRKHAES